MQKTKLGQGREERKKGDANLFFASYNYEELINRDKAGLDIFWLRDESLEESDNLPDPDVLAQEVVVPRLASLGTTPSQGRRPSRGPRRGVEDLEAALEQFREIASDLSGESVKLKET